MKKKAINSKFLIISLILIISFCFSGCVKISDLEVKAGLKNNDFEYMNQGKVKTVVIQSTRDQGFRFTVTDKNVISDLYDMLSSAKIANKKSSLEPDYIFEMKEGNNVVHKFNYITGLDKKDSGNFYSDNKIYIVSKRIDSNIIDSYWTIRKPKNFEQVYYTSIISALKQYVKEPNKNKTIGINLKDDVEAAKFILSTDLEEFKGNLSSNFTNATVATKDKDNYDIWVTIKTQGYKSTSYKAIITFWNKNDQSEKTYYVVDEYKNASWGIKVTEEKPNKF